MSDPTGFLGTIDKSEFSVEPYGRKIMKPWGYEIILTASDAPYTAKIIHINAGARLSLQAHDKKTETWTLHSGKAAVMIENSLGKLERIVLTPGSGYTSAIGQRHRLIGIEDCDIFEASTPEIGITLRLEDDYFRPNETEAIRAEPNRGFNA